MRHTRKEKADDLLGLQTESRRYIVGCMFDSRWGGKLAFDIMIGLLRYNCTILLAVYFATVEIETCSKGKTPTVYCLAHYTILYLFSMQITTAATPHASPLSFISKTTTTSLKTVPNKKQYQQTSR